MFKLLLVSPDKAALSGLASALAEDGDVDLSWAEYGKEALKIASDNTIDLVITDEWIGDMTGLEFADRLLPVNPRINCATVSQLSPENFHDVSEGLGLMAQLPTHPGKEDAERILQGLRNLRGLMGEVGVIDTADNK
jgi:CheY-like chemotaxis protein